MSSDAGTNHIMKKCWGCSKPEEEDKPKFKSCAKCIELKIAPAVFCSRECLKRNWPRHKEFHKNYLKYEKIRPDDIKHDLGHFQRALEFFRQERKVERKIQNKSREIAMKGTIAGQSGDLEEAERKFLKALKLDPESIDGYIGLSKIYGRCHRMEDKLKYMKLGIQTCSYLILKANHKEEAQLTTGWCELVESFIDYTHVKLYNEGTRYMNGDLPILAQWIKYDVLFKTALKVHINFKDEHREYTVNEKTVYLRRSVLHKTLIIGGLVFCGTITSGNCDLMRLTELPSNRSVEDIEQAIIWFKRASRLDIGEEYEKTAILPQKLLIETISTLEKRARKMKTSPNKYPLKESKFHTGCWIIVRGLQSETGKEMNKKVGFVDGEEIKGRLPVRIDGIKDRKLLKHDNLRLLIMSDKEFALIGCLSDEKKWNYLRGKSQQQIFLLESFNTLLECNIGETDNILEKMNVEGQAALSRGDLIKAEKIFAYMLVLDIQTPEAVLGLSNMKFRSGNMEKALTWYLMAVSVYSTSLLTGKYGDTRRLSGSAEKAKVLQTWAELVSLSVDRDQKDFLHKKILKVSVDVLLNSLTRIDDRKLYKLLVVTAFSYCEALSNGKCDLHKIRMLDPEVTVEDVTESITLLHKASSLNENGFICDNLPERLDDIISMLQATLQTMKSQPSKYPQKEPKFYRGCWVIIQGLKGKSGKELNNTVGRIDGKEEALRLPVIVDFPEEKDGHIPVNINNENMWHQKLLKPENLCPICMDDREFAFVACVEEFTKWTYMRPKVEELI